MSRLEVFIKTRQPSTNKQYDIFIYFNNKSDVDYSIDLIATLNIKDTNKIKASASYLFADNLYASMGQTTFRTDNFLYTDSLKSEQKTTIQRVFNAAISSDELNTAKIRKYSFGFYKISVNSLPVETYAAAKKEKDYTTKLVETETQKATVAPIVEEQPKIIPALKVYPNPNTTGRLSVMITAATDISTEILIFDMTGNITKTIPVALTEGMNTLETDLSELAKGVYILQLNNMASKVILQ
jgi:hypothetical protein